MRSKDEHNAQNRERYRWYKDRGICTTCGRTWVVPGHVRCKQCEAQIAKYHAASYEKRLERQKQRRQERIAAGLCIDCGKPAVPGMRKCERCRMMRNDSTRKYKIHKRIEKAIQKERARLCVKG